ncbi:MAG: CoA transferase [Acidobacteriota bacterium]
MPALTGVRILSIALNLPGPVAVARLVAHGATATKVEPPSGDPLTLYSRPWYDELHAGVTVLHLDLKSTAGLAGCDTLLGAADVLLTSSRPSALARLGLGASGLAERFPTLRTVAIVGDIAAPEQAGHDLTYQAEAGLLRDRLPVTLLADLVGAERIVTTVLLALRSAPGSYLQVGLRDVMNDLRRPRTLGLTTPGARFGGGDPAYGVYATRDGTIAVAALEPHFRARLYDALHLPIDAPLNDVMATRTCADWIVFARQHDLPISMLNS